MITDFFLPDGISCKDYLYVRSVKGSSAEYNVQYLGNELSWTAGVVDDLYHTGYVSLSMSNRQDCLYFTTEQRNNESGKNEYRIYLVRVKR